MKYELNPQSALINCDFVRDETKVSNYIKELEFLHPIFFNLVKELVSKHKIGIDNDKVIKKVLAPIFRLIKLPNESDGFYETMKSVFYWDKLNAHVHELKEEYRGSNEEFCVYMRIMVWNCAENEESQKALFLLVAHILCIIFFMNLTIKKARLQ